MIRNLNPIKNLRRVFSKPGRKRKIYVFLVCLGCSSFFWLFIKLSRPAQADFEQPVSFVNIPSDVVLGNQSHSSVKYTVQSAGIRLLAYRYLFPTDTLYLNARNLGAKAVEGDLWHFVAPGQLRAGLSARFDGTRTLISFYPDTLFVKLLFASEKKIPVKLNASISFVKRFGQYGSVELNPDSVIVRGPSQMVDTLKFIETEHFVLEGINQNMKLTAALVNHGSMYGLSVAPKKIEITIPVEEFTEKSIEIPLQVICAHTGNEHHNNLRLFPKNVTVTCLVSLKDYASLDASMLSVHVNCPADAAPGTNRLEVFVGTLPAFVSIQSIRPATVEFLIME